MTCPRRDDDACTDMTPCTDCPARPELLRAGLTLLTATEATR